MLMFVFGAGASFDSDPYRRPDDRALMSSRVEHRPPLATGLFDPVSWRGKDVIAAFPRAAPLIMLLRQATAQGLDVEEVLEQFKASESDYPGTAVQLLAFRAYLARLMAEVPAKWIEECQGLTNYVRALDEADRWNATAHRDAREPVAFVTFNYDSMLEQAVNSVYGIDVNSMERYTSSRSVHIFKPHGSVTWRQSAHWDEQSRWTGDAGLSRAINLASALEWTDNIDYVTGDRYQDSVDASLIWLPALSIPVRRKTAFTMPDSHKDAMVEDLRKVTTLVAVGWRARERHFLDLLQEHLGTDLVRLVAVAENDEAARETIDNLWVTGRFDNYAISGVGFSGFTERPTERYVRKPDPGNHTALTLNHVLSAGAGPRSGIWTQMQPPRYGRSSESNEEPFAGSGYVDI